MAFLDRHRAYRSGTISYFNGAVIEFNHGWTNFDPTENNYDLQLWAVCNVAQRGYSVGDTVEITRGYTNRLDSQKVYLKIRDSGLFVVRLDGNGNEASINPARWDIYAMGVRY